jgi:hypothetical protein
MNRVLLATTALAFAVLLSGCPVYPGDQSYRVCNSQGCFACPDRTFSGACVPWTCNFDTDCAMGDVCSGAGVCVEPGTTGTLDGASNQGPCQAPADCGPGSTCGADNLCHAGDCGGGVGCPSGYTCTLAGGGAQCLSSSDSGATWPDSQTSDATSPGTDGGAQASEASQSAPVPDAAPDATLTDAATLDASHSDAGALEASPVDSSPAPGPCNADTQCGGMGAKCIDGQCTAQDGLCSDTTQCLVAGDACVDGRCLVRCSLAVACPGGFSCDFTRGVCSVNPSACAANAPCPGGAVCVESHCVGPCGPSEAAAPCPAGEVCVNGGCLPDERATFQCKNAGQAGQLANACDPASICLHGDCYPACEADANSCTAGSQCKNVKVAAGTFAVCGTSSNLGSDCDPAAGVYCSSGGACIDGYCK